jgi:hypothetical protein
MSMNVFRMWLALALAAWLVPAGHAAPAPALVSQGPITDALRLIGLLPRAAPLHVCPAVLAEEGIIALERRTVISVRVRRNVPVMVPVTRQVVEAVRLPGGKVEQRTRQITELITQWRQVEETVAMPGGAVETVRLAVKTCKFFVVSKEGKLETVDAPRAVALLKKKTAVLTGDSAEVEPRALELIRPGTLCVIVPPPAPPATPAPDRPPR